MFLTGAQIMAFFKEIAQMTIPHETRIQLQE